jgi:hypothetical protein
MSLGAQLGSGRALRLDPFALPVRYAARDGGADGQIRQVELDRDRVVLRRAVHGIRMNVGVPVAEFRGVSIRILPAEGDEPAATAVMLEHRDAGLSIPLFMAPDGDDLVAEWKSWSRVLGLPLLVIEGDGSLREPFQRIGGIGGVGTPAPRRRRRAAIKWRRPRFLMRRKPGRLTAQPLVFRGEREIIARN